MPLSCQPYAAMKAREYLDKPAIHETMVKVCNTHLIVAIFYYGVLFLKEDILTCITECFKIPIQVLYTSTIAIK